MNKKSIGLIIVSFLFLVNAGFQSSQGEEKPNVNFYGTVRVENHTDPAENITISGLIENIKLYDIPSLSTLSPRTAVTEARLDDIKNIGSHPGKNIKKFSNREYVEITVLFEGGLKKNFLVERSRKLQYDIPVAAPRGMAIEPLKKEVAFEALQEVKITGYKQKQRQSTSGIQPVEKSAAQEALCSQAKRNIEELEKESQGRFSDLIQTIKEAVYYLCG